MDRATERGIEWDCQKILRQYYHHIDHHEFEQAVQLFAEDVTWQLVGLDLTGRDAILEALHAGLGSDTIRHVVTNIIVNVIDEDHADLLTYTTIYYSKEGRREDMDQPLPLSGPHRLVDTYAKMRWHVDAWQIAARGGGGQIFRRPDEPITIETWAKEEGRLAPKS